MLQPDQRELLRKISLSVGELSSTILSGVEKGAVLSLSITIETLLSAEAPNSTFMAVRDSFSSFPTPGAELRTLYGALISVCEMAVAYDESLVESICASILSLSPSLPTQLN